MEINITIKDVESPDVMFNEKCSHFKWITAPPIYRLRQLEKIANKKIEMTKEQWEEWKKYGR